MFRGGWRHRSSWVGELLRRFTWRCDHRECDAEAELGWEALPDDHLVLRVQEGKLLTYPVEGRRGLWNLYMQWGDGHGDKFLAQLSRAAVERLARQIRRMGPPGGPDFRGQRIAWRYYDDETEHAVAVGGGLRLMPPVLDGDDDDDDDDGVLLFAHNDPNGSVSVLGVGGHDELQVEAEDLGRNPGPRVRLSIGGRWRDLKVLGADGLVGYLELGDDLFVLGHLGGDRFGLACQSGGEQRALRTYSLDEVKRGDLGSVQGWADVDEPRSTRPSTTWRPFRGSRPAQRRREDRYIPESLQGTDLIDALIHLTPKNDLVGEAARMLPKILNGIRGCVQLELGNKIDWAGGILRMIREVTGQQIHCCAKILNACFRWIAERTKLLVRHRKKWELRLGDLRRVNSELLRWMIRRGPLDLQPGQQRRAQGGEDHPSRAAGGAVEVAAAEPAAPASTGAPAAPAVDAASTSNPTASSPSVEPGSAVVADSPAAAVGVVPPSSSPSVERHAPVAAHSPVAAAVVAAPSSSSPARIPAPPAGEASFKTFSCAPAGATTTAAPALEIAGTGASTTTAAPVPALAGTGASTCVEPQADTPPPEARPVSRQAGATHPSFQLLASMSPAEMIASWAKEVQRCQENLAGLMPAAAFGGPEAMAGMATALGPRHDLAGMATELGHRQDLARTPGGWIRRVLGTRKRRPP